MKIIVLGSESTLRPFLLTESQLTALRVCPGAKRVNRWRDHVITRLANSDTATDTLNTLSCPEKGNDNAPMRLTDPRQDIQYGTREDW